MFNTAPDATCACTGRSYTLGEVVELAVFRPGQERADLAAGVDQRGAGRVARVAHGHPAVRQRPDLDAVAARVSPRALPPVRRELVGGDSVVVLHPSRPSRRPRQKLPYPLNERYLVRRGSAARGKWPRR